MRKILLMTGLCLFSTALFLAVLQVRTGSTMAPVTAHTAPVAQSIPSGPATRQLEQALTAAPDPAAAPAAPLAEATATSAPRISLSPRNPPKGARFVKAPTAD
ncbi:hypothetical protein EYC08_08285 [Tabrizicola sp. WMC-M-20]|nr:hypothetical protein EYC08_08285 [Tabrizicola sp. WMC-M-20]